jgi:transposase
LNDISSGQRTGAKAPSLPEEKRRARLKKKNGNKPQFELRADLFRMTGTDLTQIDSIDVMTHDRGHHRQRTAK